MTRTASADGASDIPETLRAFRSEDLKQFVRDNYRPDNMVLTVVGDVDAGHILDAARGLWSDLPQAEKPRELSPVESAHDGFRYQRMNGETKQRLLLFAMPAPDTLHPDAAPLMVLSSLLSDGRSARLYRQLKEELNLVNSAWASYESFEQMGIFTLGAEVIADDPLPAERALWHEVRRVQDEPIDPADLERIKTRIQTRRLFAQEEVMGMARNLSHYEQLGDYHLADVLLERLRAVTPEDVQRVANTYVQVKLSSLLEYLPADSTAPAPLSPPELAVALEERAVLEDNDDLHADETPGSLTVFVRSETADTQEIDLPGGGKLLYKERRDLPIVAFNALFRGGKKRETRETAGLTNLMLKTSLKGTNGTSVVEPLSAEEIANRVESLGTGIGLSVGMEYFGWGMKSSRDVFQEAFDIFAAVASAPAFSPDEMEKEKQSIYAEIRRQQDHNYSLANDLFASARFGDEHPYGLPASGLAETVERLYSLDLRNWYAAQVQPSNLIVSCVGAISAQEAVDLFGRLIEERWRGEEKEAVPPATRYQPPATRIIHRQKQQTAAMMGFEGADMFSPDRYALDVLNEITSGMGGRLFRAVRGENSLAYQVTSAHRSRVDVGTFITYTSTAPENEERARDLILNALRELQQEHVTEEELRMAKASLVGEHVINMQTFAAQAGELAVIGVYDLPLDESERYLQEIQKVTAEQTRDVAIRYLNTDRYWLGVVRGGRTEES